jgi:ligand-binding SRPBCC domain-containing protein
MKIYHLRRIQSLPITINEAWDFFSSPLNLEKLTPKNIGFSILYNSGAEKMYAGQIIHYTIQFIPFIKSRWTTEITHVSNHNYFIDEQRFGPYASGTTNMSSKKQPKVLKWLMKSIMQYHLACLVALQIGYLLSEC